MSEATKQPQPLFTPLHAAWMAGTLLAVLLQLSWEATHGGIRTHHFLQRADWPGIHNAWGLLILPVLAWWAVRRALRRGTSRTALSAGFGMPLLLGLALSFIFAQGAESASAFILLTTIALAVLLPGYRAECLLGWVLGMSLSFGATLPLTIGLCLVALSAMLRLLLWPLLLRLLRGLRSKAG